MSVIKKALVAAAGAAASYYAAKYVTALLEQKPLKDRYFDAKSKVYDFKDSAGTKLKGAKDSMSSHVQALSNKVDSLIQKSDKTGE